MKRAPIIGIMLIMAGLSAACGPRVTHITPTAAATEAAATAEPTPAQSAAGLTVQPATTGALPTSTAAATASSIDQTTAGSIEETEVDPRVRLLTAAINVRSGPGVGFAVIAALLHEETAAVLGRNLGGDWYLVRFDNGPTGWVAANLAEVVGGEAADIAVAATIPAPPTATPEPASPVPTVAGEPPADDGPPVARATHTPTPNSAPTEPARPTTLPTMNPYP